MELQHLRTFVAVAGEGSITRASSRLHLSQPAVSAQVKQLEDALGLPLFERTARGMSLTAGGRRLLDRAEQALAAHQQLLDEARRLKGGRAGILRLGVGGESSHAAIAALVAGLAQRCPEVEVILERGSSRDVLDGLRDGRLDAGFYNEAGEPDPALTTVEVARFGIDVVAPRGTGPLDWCALAHRPWIYPTPSRCGDAAERLFATHGVRPRRVISVDREDLTRTLVAAGVGVGLLRSGAARAAQRRGEVEILIEAASAVRVLFAHLATRARHPLLGAATARLTPPRARAMQQPRS